ncbi:hypothetical protein [Allofournierella sp.]|uniref:hypothetical protein n=1 Tax=Allofournierella sp. TaxID=1940256 RepID=UPI003AB8233D
MDKLRDITKRYGFWLLWLALTAALLVRVHYCTAGEEEAYFLAEANAYLKGLVPIQEMWGGTYFSALIFMPLAAAFHAVTGGYTGVFLFLRTCYVLFTAAVSAASYGMLRRFAPPVWAGAAALLGLIFTPLNLNTFSYNSMALHFAMLFVLAALWGAKERRAAPTVLSGAFFALTVQAYPPMIVLAAVCLVLLLCYEKGTRARAFGAFCGGGAAVLLVFLAVLRLRAPFSVYLQNLDALFIRDSVHQGHGGPVSTLVAWLASCRYWYGTAPILTVGALWLVTALLRRRVCRGRKLPGWTWPAVWAALLAVAAWGLLLRPQGYMYYSNMKWFIPGLLWPAVLFAGWPKKKGPGLVLCLTGMCYAVGIFIGTDLGVVNASYGFYFCVIGELLWLAQIAPKPGRCALARGAALTVLAVLLPVQLVYMRFCYDSFGNPARAAVRLEEGPMKGLYVEPEKAKAYEGVLRDVAANVPEGMRFLVVDNLPYAYLLGKYMPCSPAPWINDLGDPQLELFYTRNPRLLPEYVLVAAEATGAFNRVDTSAESLPEGYLKDLLLQPDTERTETTSGTIYHILQG